jgi:hypothetical protein
MGVQSIVDQLAEVTATSWDGDHLIQLDRVDIVLDTLEVVSVIAASAYLSVGRWDATHPCSSHVDCVLPAHVSDPAATVGPDEDEEDQLVRRASRPSLATLYKRARQTGLVAPSPQGYF